jgi:hypothetical protein
MRDINCYANDLPPQPQRPSRVGRVRADENVAPTLTGLKTIHQRNKSSPALSTMLGAAGLKAPAKRSAFGDVSNTFNGSRPTKSKDGLANTTKQGAQLNEKLVTVAVDKKSTALGKQVSRPYSVSNLRGLLTGTNGITGPEVPPKPASSETSNLADSRKIVSKRPATTIFKDTTLPAIQDPILKSLDAAQPAATLIPAIEPLSLPEVSFGTFISDNQPSESYLTSDTSIENTEKSSAPPDTSSSDTENGVIARSDDVCRQEKAKSLPMPADDQQQQPQPIAQARIRPLDVKPSQTISTKSQAGPDSHVSVPDDRHYSQVGKRAEPEEYWEEEEEDDDYDDAHYDEDGYVTARTFPLRGENTTEGATTLLFPPVNQKIKREIEAAKQLVEAERTPEDFEDECFDTSMVAEYGEEIFEYMGDLEVGSTNPVDMVERRETLC